MNKVEIGVVVTVVLAIVAGALFIGQIDGRLKAVENDRDFASIIEQKEEILSDIIKVKQSVVSEFSETSDRISALENKSKEERKPGEAITLSHGASGAWGNWTGAQYCPAKHYVCGLEQRTEPSQGKNDDTGTTGVRFFCCPL
ncbi:hypothetical protein R50072_34550 [Simiduia litorea]|uniref:hypothetical protein n=1 Tax=Simiduia litorea TaxID=1435348 RepID=UPI0036F20BD3